MTCPAGGSNLVATLDRELPAIFHQPYDRNARGAARWRAVGPAAHAPMESHEEAAAITAVR